MGEIFTFTDALLEEVMNVECSTPFKAEARLNIIEEFSPYLKENTTLHHYKDQLVNAV
jgi:hypothetical protein